MMFSTYHTFYQALTKEISTSISQNYLNSPLLSLMTSDILQTRVKNHSLGISIINVKN